MDIIKHFDKESLPQPHIMYLCIIMYTTYTTKPITPQHYLCLINELQRSKPRILFLGHDNGVLCLLRVMHCKR